MQITEHETYIEIRSDSRFSARQTFTCGQIGRAHV